MLATDAERLWAWYRAGGRAAVAAWLRARDVSAFLPGATPMMTEAKAIMLSAGLSAVEAALVDMMRERRGEFALGAIKGPWQGLVDRLQALMPVGTRCSVHTLFHAAREAGWVDLGRVKTTEHPTRVHMFADPQIVEKHDGNRSEIRRLVETAQAPALRMVK